MIYLVTGGSASGKSEYAENLAAGLAYEDVLCPKKLYYLATMDAPDEESRQRVEKHRNQRKDKGFITIEKPVSVGDIKAERGVVLLEDLSNLLANEMYSPGGSLSEEKLSENPELLRDIIFDPIMEISRKHDHLVIVTNEITSDIPTRILYVEMFGKLNVMLGQAADEVIEVVCAVPVFAKSNK